MFKVEMTSEERSVLIGVLEYDISELHRELADTDNWQYKAGLKEKHKVLQQVLENLKKAKEESIVLY